MDELYDIGNDHSFDVVTAIRLIAGRLYSLHERTTTIEIELAGLKTEVRQHTSTHKPPIKDKGKDKATR